MLRKYRKTALFFDIDATLCDPATGKIPQSAVRAIARWRAAGYACCLATGRSYHNAFETDAANYEWDGAVCTNGQQIADWSGKLIKNVCFSNELSHRVIATAQALGHPLIMVAEEKWLLVTPANENLRECLRFFNYPEPPLTEYHGERIINAIVSAARGYDYAPYAKLGLRPAISYYPYADLVIPGITKASSIKEYLKVLGAQRYYGFGDSMNDVDMLREADLAVVLGSGDPRIRQYADIVTGPIGSDGLGKALDELFEREDKNEE